jgi:hypothetical protein
MKMLSAIILLSVLVIAAINSPIMRPEPVRVPRLVVLKPGKGKGKGQGRKFF